MGIVLLVAVVLAGATTALLAQLTATAKLAGRTVGLRRGAYLCEGVATLAGSLMEEAAAATMASSQTGRPQNFQLNLDPLRAGVEADGVIIDELSARPSAESRISVVAAGPLAGLETATVDLELRIQLKGPNMPPCQARTSQPLASVSLFQFPVLSVGALQVSESASSSIDVPRCGGVAWGRTGARASGIQHLSAVSGSDSDMLLPSPFPESPGTSALGSPRPPLRADLRFLIEHPDTPDHIPLPDALPYLADIRIVDGEWYLKDDDDPMAWPGRRIWSDHPCEDPGNAGGCSNAVSDRSADWRRGNSVRDRRLYSHYERNGRGLIDGETGGAGVVSYGSVIGTKPAAFLSSSLCKDSPGFGPSTACAFFVAADGPDVAGRGGPSAGLLDSARGGFGDPDMGAVLPINLHLGALGAAIEKRSDGELGTHICMPLSSEDPGTCQRVFNGVIYVTTTRGSSISGGSSGLLPAPAAESHAKLPWPLCGTVASSQQSIDRGEDPGFFTSDVYVGCDDADWAKPNAVRLIGAEDLSMFQNTGLTIATDLPLFTTGDVNTRTRARVSLMAERVTVLSDNYRDENSPPIGSRRFPSPPAGRAFVAHVVASILSGAASSGRVQSVVRSIEPGVRARIVGSVVDGFSATIPDRGPSRLELVFPEPLFRTSPLLQPPGAPRATFPMAAPRR
jgi:hypothetical protein